MRQIVESGHVVHHPATEVLNLRSQRAVSFRSRAGVDHRPSLTLAISIQRLNDTSEDSVPRSHPITDSMSSPRAAPFPSAASTGRVQSILSLEGVTKDYTTETEPVRALDNVSLEIEAGRFVALVGRSGCGKSTLLHLAGAMDFPTSGNVILDGVSTDRLTEAELTRLRRERVGFVFQSFQLLHSLSVAENVDLPLLLAGHAHPRPVVLERLASVGLADLAHRMPHQLSGGQMQRVAIARALVHCPRILLADEPTGNLDTVTSNSILELLRRISSEQNTTILMATHSEESASLVDAVVRMRDGRIAEVAVR
jgi:putative ABC transport system ATP-binding protein